MLLNLPMMFGKVWHQSWVSISFSGGKRTQASTSIRKYPKDNPVNQVSVPDLEFIWDNSYWTWDLVKEKTSTTEKPGMISACYHFTEQQQQKGYGYDTPIS